MQNMRNAILGVIGGLVLGTAGALAYSHYLGDGADLADLQAKLDSAKAALAKADNDRKELVSETSGATSQVDQLQASNAALKKELEDAKQGAPVAATPPPQNLSAIAGIIGGMMRGGQFNQAQRMFLLQKRLKLTPEQNAAILAAMDADNKNRRDAMKKMFDNGGKTDPAAPQQNLNSLDKTLQTVLTPAQQAQYAQLQSDEKASRSEIAATVQVNQMAPLMQFTDQQKEQVLNALYQVQSSAPDPTTLIGNPNAVSTLTSQAQATQAALAKVLTPDQLALYQQQAAVTGQGGGGFGGGGRRREGANGGGTASGATSTTSTPAQ